MSDESIRVYTADELIEMVARGESKSDWAAVDAMTEEELEAIIAADPDEAGMEIDWAGARLVKVEPKEPITLRVDADVLRFFEATGKDYRSRMNAALRAYMVGQQSRREA